MTVVGLENSTDAAVRGVHDALDQLLALDLDARCDDAILELVRDAETAFRRTAAVEARVTAELDRRGVAFEHGCGSTAALLTQLLRISRAEARARVRAADRVAERRGLTGELLPARYPSVAAAQADGEISPRHAAEITDTLEKLPAAVDEAGEVAGIETFLVDHARQFPPEELAKVSKHLLDVLAPDGTDPGTEDYRDRRRELSIRQRPDGSVTGTFEGTAEFGEVLLTLLDVTAAPTPAEANIPDPRTAGQRRHDGLLDAMRLALRAGELPTANGVLATVILTMTADQWAATSGTETGLASTGHGALVSVPQAKRIARGQTRLFPVVLANTDTDTADPDPPPDPLPASIARIFRTARPVTAYGTNHRLFTENQHLACGQHHRDKDRNGWTVIMINHIPHWIAPSWLDPTQSPQRNRAHDPVLV